MHDMVCRKMHVYLMHSSPITMSLDISQKKTNIGDVAAELGHHNGCCFRPSHLSSTTAAGAWRTINAARISRLPQLDDAVT